MQDRPTAKELLDAVAAFLEEDVMPELSGRKSFHVRVSANLLRILSREWELEPSHVADDSRGIAGLLGHDGTARDLADELAAAIRRGEFDDREEELLSFLREAATRKLLVASPRHLRSQD